jgi:hypothetical protein
MGKYGMKGKSWDEKKFDMISSLKRTKRTKMQYHAKKMYQAGMTSSARPPMKPVKIVDN